MVATISQVDTLDGFRFHLLAGNKSQPTIKNYMGLASQWLSWCDDHEIDPEAATRNHVMAYLGQRAAHCASSTIRLTVIGLRVFYDYLGDKDKNPARDVKIGKQVARPVEPFTVDELRRLRLSCKGATEVAVFYLLLGSGIRRNEVAGIKAEDVNFTAGTIRIFGKGRKYRTVRPGNKAMEALSVALWGKDRLIDSTAHDYAYRLVKRWARIAGITERAFTHRFRYTFAVQFLENGGSIEHLQTILGHSAITQSLFYSRANREQRALDAQLAFNPADRLAI